MVFIWKYNINVTNHIDFLQQVVTKVLEEAGYTRDCAFSLEDFIQVQKFFSVYISFFPEHARELRVVVLVGSINNLT
jgi:hypothetical protein